jgi:hypothetical protein
MLRGLRENSVLVSLTMVHDLKIGPLVNPLRKFFLCMVFVILPGMK